MRMRGASAHPQVLNTLIDLRLYESDFRYELQLAHIVQQQIVGREEKLGDDLEPDSVAEFAQLMS